jgi:branched-chain amino acid transport system ATP-binding protein
VSALLDIRGLRAGYSGADVLHDVALSVAAGGVTTLLGANGAGKSSTLRAISGMIRRAGSISFEGRPIETLATEAIARLGIAHVPEGRGTFQRLTVAENLEVGAMPRRDTAQITADIERVYGYFPILRHRHKQAAGLLSGGEQQMLAVGRALMLRPRLILLDEPSFGLAPLVVRDLFAILAQVRREAQVAMLIVEQNAALALGLADQAYLLETGRIVLSGPAHEIAKNDRVRSAYLGA